jgi:Ni/Co efflux regulator RcnB
MKKLTVVLAALASLAVAAPTIASAEGMHKGMHHGMMHRGMMHRHMHRDMMMHRHHHGMMHHMMKKEGM